MHISSATSFLFKEQGARRWITRQRLPKPNAIIPLTFASRPEKTSEYFAYSTDRPVLNMTEELVERLNKEFPPDVLPSGFAGPSGVPGNFNSLLCCSGMGMDPLALPVMDNHKRIEAKGLRTTIAPGDLPFLKELVRLFFGAAAPESLHLRKAASTGFPYFTSDIQYRKLGVLKMLRNPDHFLSLVTSNNKSDLAEALNIYHAIMISSVNERQQANKVIRNKDGTFSSAPRYYPTIEEARSGNYVEKLLADMSVHDRAGNVIDGHFAMRRRTVFGFAGLVNYFLAAIFGCFRTVYLDRFSFTYKARDDRDKEEKISKYRFTVGSDVSTMDQLIPAAFFDEVYNEMANYMDERVVELIRRTMSAPYVVPPPWRETPADYDPVFGGTPLDPANFKTHVGLPSGVAMNPDFGKLWMTFVYVILFRDAGAIAVPADLEPFLQGRNPDHALMDMSDDACMLTNSPSVRDRLAEAKSPYAALNPETPTIFLGSVFCESAGRKISVPNPLTYITNLIVREDSIDRMDPVRWAEGIVARTQQYSRTPTFRDLNAVFESVVRKHLGVSIALIARQMAKRQTFSDIDALVIANPHYLHYRVDPADVSPDVLDSLVATIPAADFYDDIKHLFKINVQ